MARHQQGSHVAGCVALAVGLVALWITVLALLEFTPNSNIIPTPNSHRLAKDIQRDLIAWFEAFEEIFAIAD